jgi:hypothetical protein
MEGILDSNEKRINPDFRYFRGVQRTFERSLDKLKSTRKIG